MFYRMGEKGTTSQICKKAFNSHKLINEFNKSKENMILLIEDKEYHNLASEKVKYQTNKIKIMELLILKLKFLLLSPKLKAASQALNNQRLSRTQGKTFLMVLLLVLKAF